MHTIKEAEAWNSALGCAWAEQLRIQCLDVAGAVIEIGPGFTDKVARGLAAIGFRGTVVLVEPNAAAGAWALARYRQLLPAAAVQMVRRAIPAGQIPAPPAVEALLANHILDDLILHAALPPLSSQRLFARMKPGADCAPAFIQVWRELFAQPARLERLLAQVAQEFTAYVQELQPRLVLLNQYPSWQHGQHGLDSIHAPALRLMQLLEASLGAVCRPERGGFGSFSQRSLSWLVGTFHDSQLPRRITR